MKRQIILIGILFSILLYIGGTEISAESNEQSTSADILERITSAQGEVSYVGKRITISWGREEGDAREELVVHQPPSIHFVRPLTPHGRRRSSAHRRNRPDSEKNGLNSERKHRDRRFNSRDSRRSSGRFFPPRAELLSRKNMALLIQNYDVTLSDTSEEFAGHETNLLVVKSKFNKGVIRRIWVAKDRAVILRSEELDDNGNLRSMSVYTQISFDEEHVAAALSGEKPPSDKRRGEHVSLEEARTAFGKLFIQPSYLPKGFELQSVRLMKFDTKPTVHLQYTDGLVMFSLFEEESPDFSERSNSSRMRVEQIDDTPVKIMARRRLTILQWSQEKVGLTLIGELNQSEMIRIATSMIRGE